MDSKLEELVARLEVISDVRNRDRANFVTFTLEHPLVETPTDAQAIKWTLIASQLEPLAEIGAPLPINLIWICYDPTSSDYKKVFKRRDYAASGIYNSTWLELTLYAQIFEEAQYFVFDPDLIGRQGPQGIQGIQGLKGDKGDKGDQGIQGVQGLTGGRGAQGVQGADAFQAWLDNGNTNGTRDQFLLSIKGDKGDKGDTGPRGVIGETGVKGDQGVQGPVGIGAQGVAGPKGETGLKGDKGDIGLSGTNGIQGIKGDKGDKGDQGLQGNMGVRGLDGPRGLQGDQGPAGVDGSASCVQRAGDTMTGALILSGDPTATLQSATKQYVDNFQPFLNLPPRAGYPSSQSDTDGIPVYADFKFSRKVAFTCTPRFIDSEDREVFYVTTGSPGAIQNLVFKAFRYASDQAFVYSNDEMRPAFLTADQHVAVVYNASTYFVFCAVYNQVSKAYNTYLILTEGSSDWTTWNTYVDLTAHLAVPGDTCQNFVYDRATDRLIKLMITSGRYISVAVYDRSLNVIREKTRLCDSLTDVDYTDPGGTYQLTDPNNPYLAYQPGVIAMAYDPNTETLYSMSLLAGIIQPIDKSSAPFYRNSGLWLSYHLPKTLLLDGVTGGISNNIPFRTGNNYKFMVLDQAGTGMFSPSEGICMSMSYDEFYRTLYTNVNNGWDDGTYMQFRQYDLSSSVVAKNLEINSAKNAAAISLPDASPWAKDVYHDISLIDDTIQFLGTDKNGSRYINSKYYPSQRATTFTANDTIKLVPNTWTLVDAAHYTADDVATLTNTGRICTVVGASGPAYYMATGADLSIKSISALADGKRKVSQTGYSLPQLPAEYIWYGAWAWNGSPGGPTFYYYVHLVADNGTPQQNFGRIVKCTNGVFTLLPGIPFESAWNTSRDSLGGIAGPNTICSMCYTDATGNIAFGASLATLGGSTPLNICVLAKDGTFSTPLQLGDPYSAGSPQISYHVAFGYYISGGSNSYAVHQAAAIHTSKNPSDVNATVFTEDQFFKSGNFYLSLITISPAVGLIAYILSYPVFLGGYYSLLPDTSVTLFANATNYIYVRRDPADRTKYLTLVLNNQILPNSFSRVLVAKVVTNATDVLSSETFSF